MIQTNSLKLQTSCIRNVPFDIYEKNFTFIVNGEEFKTSKIISDIISPYISKIHSRDPTFDRIVINTKHKGDFSHILRLINFDLNIYPESELPFLHEVFDFLGNDYIKSEEIKSKEDRHQRKFFFNITFFLSLLLLIYSYQFLKITPSLNNVYHYIIILPNNCYMFNYILNLTNNSCENQCIKDQPIGQFGNSVIEVLRGVQFARATGLKEIYVPHGFSRQLKSFNYTDITFKMSKPRRYKYFHNECHLVNLYDPFKRLPRLQFKADPEFVDWINSQYPKIDIPDDTLVAHVRSGGIFGPSTFIHPLYGQPPCQYYLDAFKKGNFSKLIIVSMDEKNPCVNILKNHSGIYNKNSFETDFSIMLNAKNLIISRGSFGYAAALFSKKLKNFYTFNSSSTRLINHWNCVPTDKYWHSVIANWTDSQDQREMIINSSCARWEFVPNGNQDLEAYIHDNKI